MILSKSFLVLAAASLLAVNAVALQHNSRPVHKYSYALITKNGQTEMGDWSDSDFDATIKQKRPDRLYVRKQGKTYIITDPSTLAQVEKAFAPMEELGKKQSALGDQQSKLGDAQTKIGDKQTRLGDQMSKLGEQMGQVAGKDDADSRAKMDDLQKQMDTLQKQMDALSRQMDEPSRRQDALGKRQEALGRQQERESAIAEQKVEKIIDQAFAKGLAKPI